MIKNAIFIAMQHKLQRQTKRSNTFFKVITLAAFLIASMGGQTALAGGKPVGKKRLFLIPALAYFFNSSYWDPNGVHKTYDNGEHFGSTILSLNSEYGLTRRLSLVGSVPFIINKVTTNDYSASISGFGDGLFGMRYYVANIDYNVYFSVQGELIVPLYASDINKRLGYDKLGSDVRFIGAGDFSIGSKKFYWELNTGFVDYFGGDGPFQLKNSLSLSYSINKRNQISVAGTSLYSYSRAKNDNSVNPLDVSDTKQFNFNQITGSYSYSIKRNKSLFFSFSKFLTGTNTGAGTTLSVGYVYKY
jgi:hypothetical protein